MKNENDPLNERLLFAWIRITTILNSDRITSLMPLNEAILCNLLYRNELEHPDSRLTATDLCRELRMQKSQMNRTLTSMEKKGLIRRERSGTDKRNLYIIPILDHYGIYQQQHEQILRIVDNIIKQLGEQEAARLTDDLYQVCNYTEDDIQ